MNIIFLSAVCLVSFTLAEPPVGNGYPASRSSDHHHHHHHDDHSSDHASLPQEYGPPTSRNAISTEYGTPNARQSQNRREQNKDTPSVSISYTQRLDSASSRNSFQGYKNQGPSSRNGLSQQYGIPESRSLSQEYGAPSPSARNSLSTEYGAPTRYTGESGITVARSSQKQPVSSARNQNALPNEYSVPKSLLTSSQSGYADILARSNVAGQGAFNSFSKSASGITFQSYGAPNNGPSSTYEAPSSLSTTYGVPSRSSDSYHQENNAISQSYGTPSEIDLSETYDAPNARIISQEYGVPSSRSNSKTDAVASSYSSPSSRSSPSLEYLPAARGNQPALPAQQYGVPEQNHQGYEESRARALEELLNQEPVSYDFGYQIEDQESGSDFGHSETREDNRAVGSYFVVLPDGTKQTVEYEADEGGFKPRISLEPASTGYDDNAQDLARSQGPY